MYQSVAVIQIEEDHKLNYGNIRYFGHSPGDVLIVADFNVRQHVRLMTRHDHVDGVLRRRRSDPPIEPRVVRVGGAAARQLQITYVEAARQDLAAETPFDDHSLGALEQGSPTVLVGRCGRRWLTLTGGCVDCVGRRRAARRSSGRRLAERRPTNSATRVDRFGVGQRPDGDKYRRPSRSVDRRRVVELTEVVKPDRRLQAAIT